MAAMAASSSLATSVARAPADELAQGMASSSMVQRLALPLKPGKSRGALRYLGSPADLSAPKRAILRVEAKSIDAESSSSNLDSVKNVFSGLLNNKVVRNAAFMATNVMLALPALAEEVAAEGEPKGKIFDFNLTLPLIALEFLTLMVALDKIWYKPVAAIMDQRDVDIREKLIGVRDNSGEIKKLQDEAEALIKAARAETTAALNDTKKETAAALEKNLQESKDRIEKELAISLKNLEEQKEETMRGLDQQVQSLSDEIISKVIPFSV